MKTLNSHWNIDNSFGIEQWDVNFNQGDPYHGVHQQDFEKKNWRTIRDESFSFL